MAVLTLDRPVQFTHNIRPICLPEKSRRFNGNTATVIGWGSLRESEFSGSLFKSPVQCIFNPSSSLDGPQPAKLQEVSIKVWSNPECASKYGAAAPGGIIESMLCAGTANRDSCSVS